jgi:uncharacterized delta-60 repeat protein
MRRLALLGLFFITASLFSADNRIVGRHLFYNNSLFDANNSTANRYDDFAIATDKQPLVPGQRASFKNYSSFSKGLNGIMVDFVGKPPTLTSTDVEFYRGNDGPIGLWRRIRPSPLITSRSLGSSSQITRVSFIFPDNLISECWVHVVIKANARTGLTQDEHFFFANVIGETGNSSKDALVDQKDVEGTEAALKNQQGAQRGGSIEDEFDFNRDGIVDESDVEAVKTNKTANREPLKLIVPPIPWMPGSRDVSFGDDGRIQIDAISMGQMQSPLLILQDGSLITGRALSGGFSLSKHSSLGETDKSFGHEGSVWLGLSDTPLFPVSLLESEGKILAISQAGGIEEPSVLISAFTTSGVPVSQYGQNGVSSLKSALSAPFLPTTAALQTQNGQEKLLIAGYQYTRESHEGFLTIFRILPSGEMDPSFQIVQLALPELFHMGARPIQIVAFASNFFVLAQGTAADALAPFSSLAVLRFYSNGQLAGKTNLASCPQDDLLQQGLALNVHENKITVAASCEKASLLFRSHINGEPDQSFGTKGRIYSTLGWEGYKNSLHSARFLPNGKILLAGSHFDGKVSHMAITRLRNDGFADLTFGKNGTAILPFIAPYVSVLETDPVKSSFLIGGPSFKAFIDDRYRSSLDLLRIWN